MRLGWHSVGPGPARRLPGRGRSGTVRPAQHASAPRQARLLSRAGAAGAAESSRSWPLVVPVADRPGRAPFRRLSSEERIRRDVRSRKDVRRGSETRMRRASLACSQRSKTDSVLGKEFVRIGENNCRSARAVASSAQNKELLQ